MEDIPERISGDPQGWLLGVLGSLTVVIAVFFTMIMMWTLRMSDGQWWRPGPEISLGSEVREVRGLFTQLATLGASLILLAEILGLRSRLSDPLRYHRSGRATTLRNIALVSMGGALIMLPAWNLLGAVPLGAIVGAEFAVRSSRGNSSQGNSSGGNSSMSSGGRSDPVPHRIRGRLQVMAPIIFLLTLAIARVDLPLSTSQWLSVVGIEVTLMAACVTVTALVVWIGLCRLGGRMSEELLRFVAGLRQAEFRHRAQWVHDHLLTEIRMLILSLESRPLVTDEVLKQLRDIDHRLRMAHLDELIEVGRIRISSLVQPQIRRCLDHGVVLRSVPDFRQVDVAVDPEAGRLISRVLSGLFSNALNAGAQEIGLEVCVDSAGVEIRVTDDAGGFDLAAVPPGRGLSHLIEDLGAHSVTREEWPGGSVMKVVVPHRLVMTDAADGAVPASERGSRWSCG
jgi:hypothetical protein